jgi:hypothetical protein
VSASLFSCHSVRASEKEQEQGMILLATKNNLKETLPAQPLCGKKLFAIVVFEVFFSLSLFLQEREKRWRSSRSSFQHQSHSLR